MNGRSLEKVSRRTGRSERVLWRRKERCLAFVRHHAARQSTASDAMTPTSSLQILLAAGLLWCLTTPCHSGIILTGVAPGYEPEEPTFMYTNFGIVYGTRELQKQYQFNVATDEINHHHAGIIGTQGRIREKVTPYQGDEANRAPTHSIEHSRKK